MGVETKQELWKWRGLRILGPRSSTLYSLCFVDGLASTLSSTLLPKEMKTGKNFQISAHKFCKFLVFSFSFLKRSTVCQSSELAFSFAFDCRIFLPLYSFYFPPNLLFPSFPFEFPSIILYYYPSSSSSYRV